jgi:hypothetical protein
LKLEFGDVLEISSHIDLTVSGFEMGEIDGPLGGAIDEEDALPIVNEVHPQYRVSATSCVSATIDCSAPTRGRRRALSASCLDGARPPFHRGARFGRALSGRGCIGVTA